MGVVQMIFIQVPRVARHLGIGMDKLNAVTLANHPVAAEKAG